MKSISKVFSRKRRHWKRGFLERKKGEFQELFTACRNEYKTYHSYSKLILEQREKISEVLSGERMNEFFQEVQSLRSDLGDADTPTTATQAQKQAKVFVNKSKQVSMATLTKCFTVQASPLTPKPLKKRSWKWFYVILRSDPELAKKVSDALKQTADTFLKQQDFSSFFIFSPKEFRHPEKAEEE